MLKYTAIHTPKSKRDKRPRRIQGTMANMSVEGLETLLKSMGFTDIEVWELTDVEEDDFIVEFNDDN